MKKYTFGLIGSGNMGGAVAKAAAQAFAPGDTGILTNRTPEKAALLAKELGMDTGSNRDAAAESRYLFLGVKPHLMEGMLADVRDILSDAEEKPVLVSMAAGLTMSRIREMAGTDCPVIRIMPNTPVAIGAGVILYCMDSAVTPAMREEFLRLMAPAGGLYEIDESLMDVGAAVSGCGPAFVYLLIDALADGGVANGLPRKDAVQYAAQTFLGAAQMVLETGKHPDQLKNEVCSPGGSTIRGVHVLEQHAIRATLMDAVIASYEKSRDLGK